MKTSVTSEERIKVLELEIAHKNEAIRRLQDELEETHERIRHFLENDND